MFQSLLRPSGRVSFTVTRARQTAPLSWTLRNRLTWRFLSGWLAVHLALLFSDFTALLGARIVVIVSELRLEVCRADGTIIDYGVVSNRVVTDAGVAALCDDWFNDSADITTFNYHGIGTSSTAENATDTALGAESTTALNPDSTRGTGTKSQPAANQLRSTGTLTADGAISAVEHGLFNSATVGAGTLWDRSVFSVVTLASGDSLTAQYTVTLSSGG